MMHGKKFAPYVFFPISTAEIIVMSAFSISHTKVDNDTHFQILNEIIIHDISHKRNKHMGMRTIRFTNKTMINFFFSTKVCGSFYEINLQSTLSILTNSWVDFIKSWQKSLFFVQVLVRLADEWSKVRPTHPALQHSKRAYALFLFLYCDRSHSFTFGCCFFLRSAS